MKKGGNMDEYIKLEIEDYDLHSFCVLSEDIVRLNEANKLVSQVENVEKKDVYLLNNIIKELEKELRWKLRKMLVR